MTTPFVKENRPGPRILALWLPYLATERILRGRLGRSWRSGASRESGPARPPLVVSRREDNTQRVHALDERAEGLRLKRGMGLADARAICPGIEVVEADPAADARLLSAIADWCDRYTPLVATDGMDGLFLDIAGCAHLFGGEEEMLAEVVGRLAAQGFDARGGIASTPGAAWAAARYGLPPLPRGAEAAGLAPLPLAALRLEAATVRGLESVGLRSVGPVMRAARAPLARRFGRMLILRIDQAVGAVEEAISPRGPVAPLSVERGFAEPLSRLEDVERLVPMLAASLARDLERRGEGARRLQLVLFRADGAVSRLAVGTARPVREPRLVARLFAEKLKATGEEIDVGFGYDLVRLAALSVARLDPLQADLAEDGADGTDDVAFFADRVRARLGERALLRAVMVESHVPERAVLSLPHALQEPARTAASRPGPAERPIRLLTPPEPIEVFATEVPEGPPLNFRWRRATHRIARAEGPERIAPEWWREPAGAPSRDYFRVEDREGRRYWVFREGSYGAGTPMPRWFVQGFFA